MTGPCFEGPVSQVVWLVLAVVPQGRNLDLGGSSAVITLSTSSEVCR